MPRQIKPLTAILSLVLFLWLSGMLGMWITQRQNETDSVGWSPLYLSRVSQALMPLKTPEAKALGVTQGDTVCGPCKTSDRPCETINTDTCDITCPGATCASTCPATCANTCPATCANTCPATCANTCPATCASTCANTCPATCEATCGTSCEATCDCAQPTSDCATSSGPTCGSTCGSTCSGCATTEATCENTCSLTCGDTCTGPTCEATCNGSTCTDTCDCHTSDCTCNCDTLFCTCNCAHATEDTTCNCHTSDCTCGCSTEDCTCRCNPNPTTVDTTCICDTMGLICNADPSVIHSESGVDFGDAPDDPAKPNDYATLWESYGAWHRILEGYYLGAGVDRDDRPSPSETAAGDDILDGNDDEDGIRFKDPLKRGRQIEIEVVASMPGFLEAWIDFNTDRDWLDPGEHAVQGFPLTNGKNTVTFTIPRYASTGVTFARFRFSSWSGLLSYGGAPDGEVEDYRVVIR